MPYFVSGFIGHLSSLRLLGHAHILVEVLIYVAVIIDPFAAEWSALKGKQLLNG